MKNILKDRNIVGLHMIGDLQNCDPTFLSSLKVEDLKQRVSLLIKMHGFIELGSYYHQFDVGVTGVISLSESHVSIHTWPREGYVSLDVFICNYTKDNSQETKLLFNDLTKLFDPGKIIKKEVQRYFKNN